MARSFFTFFSASYDFTGYATQIFDNGLYRTEDDAKKALAVHLGNWVGARISDDGLTAEAPGFNGWYRGYVRFEVGKITREGVRTSKLRYARRDIGREYNGDTPAEPERMSIMWSYGRKFEVPNPLYKEYHRITERVFGKHVVDNPIL